MTTERLRNREARSAAKVAGASQYFTGNPCPKGHISSRYVTTGSCAECLKFRSKNRTPEQKARANSLRAEKAALLPPKPPKPLTERQKAKLTGAVRFVGSVCSTCLGSVRYASNGQCVNCTLAAQTDPTRKKSKRQWELANKSRITAAYASNTAARQAALARAKRWAAENPEKRRVISMTYKARRRAQEAGGDSTAAVAAWVAAAPKVCHWCGIPCTAGYHVDHYVPLSKGGKHAVSNLVIACGPCNLRKNAKCPYEFARTFGRLF